MTLAAGTTSTTVTIATRSRNVIQAEYVHRRLALSQPDAVHSGLPSSAVVTIGGSTAHPVVTLTSATTYLQKGQPYTVSIGLSQAMSTPLTIELSYGGSAAPGSDYNVPAGHGDGSRRSDLPHGADPDRHRQPRRARPGTHRVAGSSAAYRSGILERVGDHHLAGGPEAHHPGQHLHLAQGGAATFVITASSPGQEHLGQFRGQGTAQPGRTMCR